MTPERQAILFERALVLIMHEWGYTRERAIAWLEDDAEDWSTGPAAGPALPGSFVQVKRVSEILF